MTDSGDVPPAPGQWGLVGAMWVLVGVPLAWGVLQTIRKALLLFQ